jgi:hypothetical protein
MVGIDNEDERGWSFGQQSFGQPQNQNPTNPLPQLGQGYQHPVPQQQQQPMNFGAMPQPSAPPMSLWQPQAEPPSDMEFMRGDGVQYPMQQRPGMYELNMPIDLQNQPGMAEFKARANLYQPPAPQQQPVSMPMDFQNQQGLARLLR